VEERDHSGYQRRTKQADALIAGVYLAGTNTRRVRRGARGFVRRRRGEGHGQPSLAQGEGRWDAWKRGAP